MGAQHSLTVNKVTEKYLEHFVLGIFRCFEIVNSLDCFEGPKGSLLIHSK